MTFGRCAKSKKQGFGRDLRGNLQVSQKVEVVGRKGAGKEIVFI